MQRTHVSPRSSTGLEDSGNGDEGGEPLEDLHYVDACSYVNRIWNEEQSTSEPHERPSLLSPISWSSEDAYSAYPSIQASSCSLEPSNSLSDLSWDYKIHISSLQYGQWGYYYALSAQDPPEVSAPFIYKLLGKSTWDVVRRSFQHKHTAFSLINTNHLVPGQPFYCMNSQIIQVPPFGKEEMWKTRGTGTYSPNPGTNHYRARTRMGKGRPQAPLVKFPRQNGHGSAAVEVVFPEKIIRLPDAHGRPYMPPSDVDDFKSQGRKSYSDANGSMHHTQSEGVLELSSFGLNPWLRGPS